MIRYKDLNENQRSEICNGCGGKGGLVRPPHGSFFREECNHHDFNYFLGYTKVHRAKADNQLRLAMQAKVMTVPLWRRLYLRPWCNTYYLAVRLQGAKYFYFNNKEQEVPNI